MKEVALGHLLTFGGHAAAAAAAITNIDILQRENLPANAAERGAYLMSRLEELRAHPTVGDVRGIGLLCGIELVKNKETKQKFVRDSPFAKRVSHLLLERGILTRAWDIVHFAPPLVVTTAELDRMVDAADESLTIAESEFAGEIEG